MDRPAVGPRIGEPANVTFGQEALTVPAERSLVGSATPPVTVNEGAHELADYETAVECATVLGVAWLMCDDLGLKCVKRLERAAVLLPAFPGVHSPQGRARPEDIWRSHPSTPAGRRTVQRQGE